MPDRGTVETVQLLGPSIWLVELAGEHDLSTAPLVEAAFDQTGMTGTIVVDVSRASFVDSTIMGVVVRRWRGGAQLLLVVPREGEVRRVLDLVGVTALLRTFETREEALQAIPSETLPLDPGDV
jgi:anti-anti-sigma factor